MTTSSRHCAVKPLLLCAEVRLYDRQFSEAHPNAGGKTPLQLGNPNSLMVVTSYSEPSTAKAQSGQKFQFERFGYFVADRSDHVVRSKPLFKRVTGFKDSCGE